MHPVKHLGNRRKAEEEKSRKRDPAGQSCCTPEKYRSSRGDDLKDTSAPGRFINQGHERAVQPEHRMACSSPVFMRLCPEFYEKMDLYKILWNLNLKGPLIEANLIFRKKYSVSLYP